MNGNNKVLVGEVRRNPSSVLKVSIGEWQGWTYVYCQTWNKGEEDPGPGTPRSLGLTMRPDTLRELLPLFSKAIAAVEAREGEKPRRAI